MSLSKRFLALAVALGMTGLVAAGATAQTVVGVTPTEIKVGNTNPYSGNASAYGTIGKTIAAYFKKVNDEGGVNGRKINFITATTPKPAQDGRDGARVMTRWPRLPDARHPPNTAIQKFELCSCAQPSSPRAYGGTTSELPPTRAISPTTRRRAESTRPYAQDVRT
jgi:branched-chain amino acid transport system substrate-binding protein